MALVSPLTLVAGSATPRFVSDSADELLVSGIQTGQAIVNLFTDVTPDTINLGTNAGVTALNVGTAMGAGDALAIGGTDSTATFGGNVVVAQDFTVNGTVTTVNSANLTVTDPLIYANNGGVASSSAGLAWDQGANDDAVLLWNGTQFQFGRADTTGGTVTPGTLATFSDLQLGNLTVESGDISAGAAASLDLLGGTDVSITAGNNAGNSVNISAPNATGTVTIATNGATRWTVDESGNLLAAVDNTQNIGAAGASRPQTVFVGTSTVVGDTITTTGSSITGSNTIATMSILTAAGDAANAAANLAITGGSSGNVANPNGANVAITAGTADATGVDGSITLVAPNVGTTPGDVSFTAHGVTIPLNEAGVNASLNTTEQNLVGAINEVLATIPGSQDLAQTLAQGNVTGANDIVVSDGQAIIGASDGGFNIGNVGALRPDNVRVLTSVVVGDSVSITSSAVTGSTTLGLNSLAGAITLTSTGGGITAAPASNAAGAGFGVVIDGGASSQAAAAGGDVTINGGAPGAAGTAGVVNVGTTNTSQINFGDGTNTIAFASGSPVIGISLAEVLSDSNLTDGNNVVVSSGDEIQGAAGSASAGAAVPITGGAGDAGNAGGAASLTGGVGGPTDGAGGVVSLTGGAGGGANGAGANATVTGGASQGTGAAGQVLIQGGGATGTGVGGNATVLGGVSLGTNDGGDLILGGGDAQGTGNGGAVTIDGGTPTDGDGGTVTVQGADAAGTNNNGGSLNLLAGDETGTGAPGEVQIGARGNSLFFNDAANSSLSSFYTGVTSIVGALNFVASNTSAGSLSKTVTNGNAGAITVGQIAYMAGPGANTVDLATAASNTLASRGFMFVQTASIASAATGDAVTNGTTQVLLETGLTLVVGDVLFISASTPGSCTNVAPSGSGNIVQAVAIVSDTQTYDGATDLLVEAEIVIGNRAQV